MIIGETYENRFRSQEFPVHRVVVPLHIILLKSVLGTTQLGIVPRKILLANWIGSKPNFILAGQQLLEVDGFSYSVSCLSSGPISNKVHSGLQMARLAFTKLKHFLKHNSGYRPTVRITELMSISTVETIIEHFPCKGQSCPPS